MDSPIYPCISSDTENDALLEQLAFDLEHGELLNCLVMPDGEGFQTMPDARDEELLAMGPLLPEVASYDVLKAIGDGVGHNDQGSSDEDEPPIKFNTKTNSVTNEVTITSVSIPRRQKIFNVVPMRIVLTNLKREDVIAATSKPMEKIKPPKLPKKKKKKKKVECQYYTKFEIPARKRKIEHVKKRPNSPKIKTPTAKKLKEQCRPKVVVCRGKKYPPSIKKPEAPKRESQPEKLNGVTKESKVQGVVPATLIEKPEIHARKPKEHEKKPKSHKKKPEIQIKKPEAPIKRTEAQIKKSEPQIKKSEAHVKKAEGKKPETQVKKPEAYAKKPEAYAKQPEAYAKQPEAYAKKPEAYAKKPEPRIKKPEVVKQNALFCPIFPNTTQIKKFKIPKLVKPIAQIGRTVSQIRSLSPIRRSLSPDRRSLSPDRRSISPDHNSRSPIQKAISPSEAYLFDDLITLNFETETEVHNPELNSPAEEPQLRIEEKINDKSQSPIEEKSESPINLEKNIFDEPAPEEPPTKKPEAPKIVAEPQQASRNDDDIDDDDDDILDLCVDDDEFLF